MTLKDNDTLPGEEQYKVYIIIVFKGLCYLGAFQINTSDPPQGLVYSYI